MKALNPIVLSGAEVLPLVEGGKGVAITNGQPAASVRSPA
jgi:nitronate monooxygenase